MKSIIAAGFLLGCAQGAIAGPYANIETNIDRDSSLVEIHKGYEDKLGEDATWFIQAGPAFVDGDREFSGKAGISYDVKEDVEVYGEYSFETGGKGLGSAVKAGVTYTF